MKTALGLFFLLFASPCWSEELPEHMVEWFKSHLEKYPHALLVCTYKNYMIDEPESKIYQRSYEEATIVQVFKGDSKVSRKIKFFRSIEGRPKLESKNPGELSFVFFDEMPAGELHLGTGDGFKYHPELLKLAEAAKAKSEKPEAKDRSR